MRINKFLSHFSGLSRRKADEAIAAGRVKVNNKPAEVGQVVNENDSVTVDSVPVSPNAYRYLLFNKPVGYVTSRMGQGNSPTIYEVLPTKYHDLKPVGRLDKDSSGLLLLTNDGEYAHELAHPSNTKQKVYRVTLHKPLEPADIAHIQTDGIALKDGISKMKVRSLSNSNPLYEITLREGRNRQIRRTFAACGYEVMTLHRTDFGPYKLNDLEPGQTTETTK